MAFFFQGWGRYWFVTCHVLNFCVLHFLVSIFTRVIPFVFQDMWASLWAKHSNQITRLDASNRGYLWVFHSQGTTLSRFDSRIHLLKQMRLITGAEHPYPFPFGPEKGLFLPAVPTKLPISTDQMYEISHSFTPLLCRLFRRSWWSPL